jgi:cytochrome c556
MVRVVGLSALLAMSGFALASSSSGVAAYRSTLMSTWSRHLKLAGQIRKGEVDRKGDLAAHAAALRIGADDLVALFPKGSEGGEARPEVWSKSAAFAEAAAAYAKATSELVLATQAGDEAAIGAALDAVGAACGGCHKQFKAD